MQEGLLVRVRATTPWRLGDGVPDATAELYHSDALYSAVTAAMGRLGELPAWLEATAAAEAPAVRFSSGYPWKGPDLFVLPPLTLWPPESFVMMQLRGARYLPVRAVRTLLAGVELLEQEWMVDPASRCLLHRTAGPVTPVFQVSMRVRQPVDRLTGGGSFARRVACLEFGPDAGVWFLMLFSGEEARDRWEEPLRAALRLLADSGFGGGRSLGWGRGEGLVFETVPWPDYFLPGDYAAEEAPGEVEEEKTPETETAYWLLSLFRPGGRDRVDWGKGRYSIAVRGGRIESAAGWGLGKKAVRMVTEGSVLLGESAPVGSALDVAPGGFPHPVYRYGFAVSVPIRLRAA